MSTEDNPKNTTLQWTASEIRGERSKDWYVAFWIIISTIAFVLFLFSGLISSLLVLSGAWAIYSYIIQLDTHTNHKYALTLKGIRIDNTVFPYTNINRFNIKKHRDTDVLILDLNSVLIPDAVIPISSVDVEDVYFYISQFVEEDAEMDIPLSHIIAERLGL